METNQHFDVIVVGSGIAGLVAANSAVDDGARVLLLDSGAGRARTVERDGVLLNEGAHALYLDGVLMRSLRGWGLEPSGFTPSGEGFAVHQGNIAVAPFSAGSVLRTPLLSFRGKLRFAKLLGGLQKLNAADHHGRSVADWLADLPADTRQVAETFVRTVTYTNAPALLDAGATIAQLQLAARASVRYVDGGWGVITASLRRRFSERGGAIDEATKADSVRNVGDRVLVAAADHTWKASAVVLAAGGPGHAAGLLGIDLPSSWEMPPVEAACLDVWASRVPTHRAVVDPVEHLFSTTHSPGADLTPSGVSLVSVLHYLAPDAPPADARSEQALMERQLERVGITAEHIIGKRYLHRMTVVHGFPMAARRGQRPSIDSTGVPGVFVAGDWVGNEGMLADAAAASGLAAARAAVASTEQRARMTA